MRISSLSLLVALATTAACSGSASDEPEESNDALQLGAKARAPFASGSYFGPTVEFRVAAAAGSTLEAQVSFTKGTRAIKGTIDVALDGSASFVPFTSPRDCSLKIANGASPKLTGNCVGTLIDETVALRPLSLWKAAYVHPSGAVLQIERADADGILVSGRSSAGVVADARTLKWIEPGIQTDRFADGCEMLNLEGERGSVLRVYGIAGVCAFAGTLNRQP